MDYFFDKVSQLAKDFPQYFKELFGSDVSFDTDETNYSHDNYVLIEKIKEQQKIIELQQQLIYRLQREKKQYSHSTEDKSYKSDNDNNLTINIPYDRQIAEYYASLELPFGYKLELVKASWKKLLKKYHPDYYTNNPDKQKIAIALSQELTKAYKEIEKYITKNLNR